MEILALFLVGCGILCMSGHSTTQSWVLRKKLASKEAVLVLQHSISIPILVLALAINPDPGTGAGSSKVFWFAVVATSALGCIIQYANARARENADVSLTAPISGMTPGMVTAVALMLGEYPSVQGVAGIILIALGTYIHGQENAKTWGDYLRPLAYLFLPSNFSQLAESEREQLLRNREALRFAYLAASCGTFGLICDGLIARNGSVAVGFIVYSLILSTTFLFLFLKKERTTRNVQAENTTSPLAKGLLGLTGIFFGLHILFVMTAFRLAPIAYVGSLKRLSIVSSILFAYVFLKEKKAMKRLLPAAIITAGAILLAFDPSAKQVMALVESKIK